MPCVMKYDHPLRIKYHGSKVVHAGRIEQHNNNIVRSDGWKNGYRLRVSRRSQNCLNT